MAKFINPFTDVGFIVLADKETYETFSDKLRFIFIELLSFKKTEEECETDFERWIYVLKNIDTLNRLPFKARKAVFLSWSKSLILPLSQKRSVCDMMKISRCIGNILLLPRRKEKKKVDRKQCLIQPVTCWLRDLLRMLLLDVTGDEVTVRYSLRKVKLCIPEKNKWKPSDASSMCWMNSAKNVREIVSRPMKACGRIR